MKKIHSIAAALLSGLLITGCDWHNNQTIVGTGDVVSMEVDLPAFDGVSVTGSCDVDIETGESQSVEFFAQTEILDVLEYEVINDILHIGIKPDYTIRNSKDISATIVIPTINFVGITGAGDFILSGDRQEVLDIHITGSGNVEAYELEVEDCTIRISGAGDCQVNVINSLDVLISGVGNVYYMGDPVVSTDVSGVGNVSAVNR